MNVLSFRQVAVVLAILVGVTYFRSIPGSFHFDDSHSVQHNISLRSLKSIPSYWLDAKTSSAVPENRVYRPLVYTFYSFCWLLGGGQTWPFHLMKMLMHVLVALALYRVWRRLWQEPGWFPVDDPKGFKVELPLFSRPFHITPDWAAMFLAAVFAIHPANSECVDYISATTSLQAALFYVWAFVYYLEFRDSKKSGHLWASLALYFCSVASKEEGITLPAMVFITELFLSQRARVLETGKAAFKAMLPWALMGVALAAWIFVMHPTEGNESRGFVSPFHYFITQWRAYLWYMRIWFWPWDLNADVSTMEYSKAITEPLVIQAAIGNLTLLVLGWFNRKRFPAFLYGLVWFYLTISPASSVVVLAEAINEHRMYLAYFGFVGGTYTLILWAAERAFAPATRAKFVGYIYAGILAALFVGAQERNSVWLNDENLWRDTVAKNPGSGRALNNLALVHMSRGEYEKTVEYLDQCERNWASYPHCPLNKGIALQALNRYDEAEKAYRRAYDLNPRASYVNYHVGRFYEEARKDYAKAAEYYKTADDATGGRYPEAQHHLAACYAKLKRTDEARALLLRSMELEPGNPYPAFELGRIELENKRFDDAIRAYERLVTTSPGHLQGWYNLGVARLAKEDFAGARTAFERTVQLDPRSEQGWFNLAFALEKLKDGKGAVDAGRRLASLYPDRKLYQQRAHELETLFGGSR